MINNKLIAYLLLFLTLSCGSEEDARKKTQISQQEDALAQSISLVTNPKFKPKSFPIKAKNCEIPDLAFNLGSAYYPTNQSLMVMATAIPGWKKAEKIKEQMDSWGVKEYELFGKNNKGQHRGFVADMDGFLLVAFRGTSDIKEFFLDITFVQVPVDNLGLPGKAHMGFKIQYENVRKKYLSLVDKIDNGRNLPIVVAGHSLGGAVGVFAALELEAKGKRLHKLYASAAPRVGNQALTNHINEKLAGKYYRLEHDEDLVTHVPPRVETKDILASILAGFFSLDKLVASAIKQANYGEHAGVAYSFNSESASNVENLLDHELDFWNQMTNNGNGNLISFALMLNEKLPFHKTKHYLCGFAKHHDSVK